ncbi:4-coumarate-CoA ligase-like protein [Stemphylium lycopersici]|nr:4-coumarate-CoA ligase-like protein [Stemphylium lycopersici]
MIAKYFTSSVASEIAYSFWISITVIGVTTIADPIDYNAITWPEVNVKSVHLNVHHFLAQAPKGKGTVISMSTETLDDIYPDFSFYIPSKLAQTKFMDSFHAEQSGIRTFSVLPGLVATDVPRKQYLDFALDDPKRYMTMEHNIFKPHWSRFLGPSSPDPHTYTYQPTNDPIFKSPYGPFPPTPSDLNIHSLCFPPNKPLPADYPLIINASTSEVLTLHDFHLRACALSRVFQHDGPNPLALSASPESGASDGGEILGLFSRNHIQYPMVAHACFRAGLVFGGISPASTAFELWWVLRKMQITSVMCHETLLPVLYKALALGKGEHDSLPLKLRLDREKIFVLSDDKSLDTVSGHGTIESLVRLGTTLPEPRGKLRGGDRLAYLFQSSGTSGLPKAMMITHSNGYHSGMQTLITAVQTARYMGTEPLPPTTTLGVIPMYHSYGMILWILRVNLTRNTTILLPKWNVEAALRSVQDYKITHLPLVPPLVRQLALSPLTQKYDLSSVVAAASGAAYLPPDVAVDLARKLPQGAAAPVPSGYGLSEAASIASPAAPGIFGLEPAGPPMIGYLLPGIEARVVDPESLLDVPRNAKGELWVRGKVVTPGYFKDEAATKEILVHGGWLRTGDLVQRDDCDRVLYLDRFKEMIKVKGLQVAATEVEDTLLQHPEHLVSDACVAGVESGRGDREVGVRAWVVLKDGGRALGEEGVKRKLREWVEGRLSRYKWLTGGIEVVDLIPRTPSGKMLRREMRDRYHERLKRSGKANL